MSEDDLCAAIDGIAANTINTHLATCGYCARRKENLAREIQTLEGGLKVEMFRQGCPDGDALADYALGGLTVAARTAIDVHLSTCLRCANEAAWVREALAPMVAQSERALRAEPEVEPFEVRLLRQVKRMFATLLPVQPQFALRGGAETRAFSADFAGGQVFVELTPAAAGHLLTGQLIFDEDDRMWKGALVQVFVGDALTATTVTDELLEFESDVKGEGPLTLSVTSARGQQLQVQAGVAGIPAALRR